MTIETAETGRYLTVTRTAQAAALLIEKWPRKTGPRYSSAVKAVMDVMAQRKTVSVVRKAFAAAAKEADVFVCEGRL
ncbi:DUF982 domain-containing protein [Mesorhizobium loti]|uniref:DUF982 domain-containing protein n=1 Tax=Rhizobium loti TaxID=381 RepID=UPI00047AF8AD